MGGNNYLLACTCPFFKIIYEFLMNALELLYSVYVIIYHRFEFVQIGPGRFLDFRKSLEPQAFLYPPTPSLPSPPSHPTIPDNLKIAKVISIHKNKCT